MRFHKSKEQIRNERNFEINLGKRICWTSSLVNASNVFKQIGKVFVETNKSGSTYTPILYCRFSGLTCNKDCTRCFYPNLFKNDAEYFINVRKKEVRKHHKKK